MRVWYIGSGAFAALCLSRMASELHFEKVITGHPTIAGRGMKERVSSVEEAALSLSLPLERTGPLSKNEALLRYVTENPPDVIFVVDFAQLVREPFLNEPRFGCLNIHPSLLPLRRGAAPIQRSLMEGDSETGVTVFRLVEAMDAGPVLAQERVSIDLETTSEDLVKTLSISGSKIAVSGVNDLIEKNSDINVFTVQNNDLATYAAKIEKSETQVFWSQPALQIHNTVRALNFFSGSYIMVRGKRLKLWKTYPYTDSSYSGFSAGQAVRFENGVPVLLCSEGLLRLDIVQAEGRGAVSGSEWARGLRLKEGDSLI